MDVSYRSTRRTVVALAAGLAAAAGGLGASVAAFGQTSTDPTSGYTVETVPLGEYTTTAPSLPPVKDRTPSDATVTAQSPPGQTEESSTPPVSVPPTHTTFQGTPAIPARTTRDAPRHLAFTGAEPLLVAAAGVGLMLAGFALHRRRRTGRPGA